MDKNLSKLQASFLVSNIENKLKEQVIKNIRIPSHITKIEALNDMAKSKDLNLLYEAEKLFIQEELREDFISKIRTSSLNNSYEQLIDAKSALDLLLSDKNGYNQMAAGFAKGRTKDANDLPLDSIRLYLKSQSTRLINFSKGVRTEEESLVVDARKNILNTFRREYIAKQAAQLEITLKPTHKPTNL